LASCFSNFSSSCGCDVRNSPHLPAYPEQENTAGQQQPDDLQQLHRDAGEANSQNRGRYDADQYSLGALAFGQTGGCQSDDDRVVAGQHQIDHHDLEKCRQSFRGKHLGHAGPPCNVQSDIAVRLNCQRGPGLDVHPENGAAQTAES
jgi:hypothetical protein